MDKILLDKVRELGESDDYELHALGTRIFIDSSPTYEDFKYVDPEASSWISEETFYALLNGHELRVDRPGIPVRTSVNLHDFVDKCTDQNCKICQTGQANGRSQEEGT